MLALLIDGTVATRWKRVKLYSHSVVAKPESVNSMSYLIGSFIYLSVCETAPKPELTWNSALSSTLALDSEE